jgi:hypothetical protein
MPKIKYQDINLGPAKLEVVKQANAIIREYAGQGFDLTLRQLYYQFVARDLIPNKLQEYKRLGDIINDARLAGLVDWDAIVDRTRNLRDLPHWDDPPDIVTAVSQQFRIDKWATQPNRVEVWIEKDALVGVIEGVCQSMDVPFFSCRGYTSQSEMWVAAQRLRRYAKRGQVPVILHFGDHDPSGIDMTRDIQDRLRMFMGGMEIRRLALNMNQVEQYEPPPNPAKLTDSRCAGYMEIHGDESWELDALEPSVLADLIRGEIESLQEPDAWQEALDEEIKGREQLAKIAERFEDVATFLDEDE